jgi:hypothetical protein
MSLPTTSPIRYALRIPVLSKSKQFLGRILLAVLLGISAAPAEQAIDLYLPIFDLIQQADALSAKGDTGKAVAKYRQAQDALVKFQKGYTDWYGSLVAYRLNYVGRRITDLTEPGRIPPADKTAVSAREAQPLAGAIAPSAVRLLEAGAQPRKVLRLHPKEGDHETVDMALSLAMQISLGEMQNQPMKIPAIKIAMETTVKNVSSDGDIAYDILMHEGSVSDEAGIPSQVADSIKSAFSSLKGLTGTGKMSNRGINKGTEMKVPADAEPQIRLVMEQMNESFSRLSAPLPEEAVGPGARWEYKMPVRSQGMTIDQTAIYKLISVEGDRFTTRSTVAQRASNQKIQSPAVPGLKVDLKSMTGKGAGDVTFDLGQILPREGTFGYESDIEMGMDMGGQPKAMSMKIDLNLRLEQK